MNPIRRTIVAVAMAAVGVSAQTPPPPSSPSQNEPWPPAGVHKPGEAGLTMPVLVQKIQPVYPSAAVRAALQGFVVIAAVIGTDGSVERTRVIQSLDTTYGLNDAAVRSIKEWRFTPGSKDGVPVPVAANFEIGFSLSNVPPPSTWPQLFINEGPDPAIAGKAEWTTTTVESETLRYEIRYPQGWIEQRGNSPTALTMLARASLRGIRGIAFVQPRKLPTDLTLPMPIPQLQRFADFMRQRTAGRFQDTMGVGQVAVGGLWWMWLDLTVDPSAVPPMFRLANGSPAAEFRMWSFTTIINTYDVGVSCFVTSFTGWGEAQHDEELRAAGRDFRNILSALTVSKKIASR